MPASTTDSSSEKDLVDVKDTFDNGNSSDDSDEDDSSASSTSSHDDDNTDDCCYLTEEESRALQRHLLEKVGVQLPEGCSFADVLGEYCRFMQLQIATHNHRTTSATTTNGFRDYLAPPLLLDRVWYSHILCGGSGDPRQHYRAFCQRHNTDGRYLYYQPEKHGDSRYHHTLELYQQHFGDLPSSRSPLIWPEELYEKTFTMVPRKIQEFVPPVKKKARVRPPNTQEKFQCIAKKRSRDNTASPTKIQDEDEENIHENDEPTQEDVVDVVDSDSSDDEELGEDEEPTSKLHESFYPLAKEELTPTYNTVLKPIHKGMGANGPLLYAPPRSIRTKEEWSERAIAAIHNVSIPKSNYFSLATFFAEELAGQDPEATGNLTRGFGKQHMRRVVCFGLRENEDDDDDNKTHNRIVARSVHNHASWDNDQRLGLCPTVQDAAKDLCGNGDEEPVYLRFWPWNVAKKEEWDKYSAEWNDLGEVGLLEGYWHGSNGSTMYTTEIADTLAPIVEKLWKTLENNHADDDTDDTNSNSDVGEAKIPLSNEQEHS